ncbi:hypothetical protein BOX15_Mlig012078g1 [Macrostomum lignano]|uniref:Amino acid permease/ SLC12A domain-containing protein n=1 Tax=Macrostomum lignano TaxID=282301 RepID=A0A267F797_9PLAT|nr:hypothetical protein BOX15_Mlig012078g1 [Macrostomum lignano]
MASEGSQQQQQQQRVALKKELTLMHGVAVIVGIIIGSGIFLSPVGVIREVKSVGASLCIWAASGVFSILGALCYAELGVAIPKSGGEYIYIKEAFGPLIGFLTLWTIFFMVCAVPTAASALIFAEYVLRGFPETACMPDGWAAKLLGACAISLLTAINCINVKWAAKTQIIFTGCKLLALVIIIILGFIHVGKGYSNNLQDAFEGSDINGKTLAFGFYAGFWAYGGWNYLNFLIEELQNPYRNLPLAIVISITIVTAVYLLANVAYAAVLSPEQIISSNAVAITFANDKMGPAAFLMPLFVAISVFGAINGGTMSISRVFYVGAREGQLPEFLAMISYKQLTPLPSLIVMLIISLALLFLADIWTLINLLGFAFNIILTLTMSSLLYLRYLRPNLHRPIKIPLPIPVFVLLWCFGLVAMTIYQAPEQSLKCLGFIAVGIPVYFLCVAWERKPASFQRRYHGLTLALQKVFMVVTGETQADEDQEAAPKEDAAIKSE